MPNLFAPGAPLFWAQAEPRGLPWLAWGLWLIVGFFGVFPGIVAYLVWGERKAAARFQDRIGPNRVGPLGLLQPIADAIKLITKESIVPRAADPVVHLLAPVIMVVGTMLVLAVIPFGFGSVIDDPETGRSFDVPFAAVDLPAGLLYLFAVSSLSALGVFLAGWASRNKYSLLGGMRAVAQLVSYEVPQILSTVPIILWAGSLSLGWIVHEQVYHGYWNVFTPPGFLAFITLTIASIAEVNRTPFDLPEAESEIIAGYHTEYSGMRFGLFFLAEYMGVLAVSCLGTVLFLGGASLPFTSFPERLMSDTPGSFVLVNGIGAAVFGAKVSLYVFVMFWIRATLPRMRVDRLMGFAWKFLVPLCLANILAAAAWYETTLRPGGPESFWLGWLVTLPIVLVSALVVYRLNRAERYRPGSVVPARPLRRDAGAPLAAPSASR